MLVNIICDLSFRLSPSLRNLFPRKNKNDKS